MILRNIKNWWFYSNPREERLSRLHGWGGAMDNGDKVCACVVLASMIAVIVVIILAGVEG